MIDRWKNNNRDSLVDKMKAIHMTSVEKNWASVHELNMQDEMRNSLDGDLQMEEFKLNNNEDSDDVEDGLENIDEDAEDD